jgi:tRNA nucleotidyltransferase/poly(A) polymerase
MEKEHTYIVEISFETVVVKDHGEPTEHQVLELHTEVATFKDFNKSDAKKRAQDFFDRTIRY